MNTCKYCGKSFQREKTLAAHMCEPMRRWVHKDEKYSRLAFLAYNRFYELTQPDVGPRTFDHFMSSNFYLGFTKFGKYIINIHAIEPEMFIDFVIKNGVKLDKWCSDSVYNTYINELNRKESADRALERSILIMEKWGREHDRPFNVFFREVSGPRAIQYIKSGHISPWVIFNCNSGAEMVDRFTDHELTLINDNLDPSYWSRKFDVRSEDVEFVSDVLNKAGL